MEHLELIRIIAGIILAILGGFILLVNYIYLYYRIKDMYYRIKGMKNEGFPSFVPIVGGLIFALALFLFEKTRAFCWIGLLLDVSICQLIICIFGELIDFIKSKINKK